MNKNKFPMWKTLEMDLHSNCNRDCKFCPRYFDRSGIRKDKNGKNVHIQTPTDKVYAVIDEVCEMGYKGVINFHRLSEALLDKRYLKFVKYAHSKGLEICENTNGDVLKRNSKLCTELDGIIFELIIGLYDYKTYKEKLAQIEIWKSRFSKTSLRFSTPLETPNIRQGSEIYLTKKKDPRIIDEPCITRLNALLIRYDGNVSLCCQDDMCTFNLGNAFEQSIEEIWWSDKHIEIIDNVRKPGGRKKYELCSKCFNHIGIPGKNNFIVYVKDKMLIIRDKLWGKGIIGLKQYNSISDFVNSI
jgi:radical SAM protein with 4Fe4S-binding SPASM domain